MKPLAVTMGDPAGIGGELTLRAWLALRRTSSIFVALDDPGRLEQLAKVIGLTVPVRIVKDAAEAAATFPDGLPVLPVRLPVVPAAGRPDKANANAVIDSIKQATALALAGTVSGIVTNPINKAALYQAGFAYPGHTELLAALTGATLRDSIAMLTTDMIVAVSRTTETALRRDFGIVSPRLAVAGLNPHAGEQGALGTEETTLVQPAIDRLRAEGLDVSGPWPPDTMFTARARACYDAAICMYHDQALIPLKTLDMDHGVNVTLGLPIVRTSPDHGTAFDIAGKGIADETSLVAAIELAGMLAARRVH
jgi:4-hydroxythreonine-4-phosphate dehydrogenase